MGNKPSAIPNGYQLNQVHLQMPCHSINNVSDKFNLPASLPLDLPISVLTPLAAASFIISDINGGVSFPPTFGFTTGILDLQIRAGIDTLRYRNIAYTTTGISLRQGPYDNAIGPYRAANNESSSISVDAANFTLVVAENESVSYVCDVPQHVIATVGNDGSSKNYYPDIKDLVLPEPPAGMKVAEANIPFSCDTSRSGIEDQQFNVSMRATIPLNVTASIPFRVDGFIFFVTPSAEEVRAFQNAANDSETGIGFFLSAQSYTPPYALGFNLTNASPALFDVAGNFVASNGSVIESSGALINFYKVKNDAVTIPYPILGNLSIGQFTPAGEGIFSMVPLGLNGLFASSGLSLVQSVDCTVHPPVELFSAIIV